MKKDNLVYKNFIQSDYLKKKFNNKLNFSFSKIVEEINKNIDVKKDTFNGRRYLGTSKFGKDIWIIMRFNKEDMQISLEIDGKLDDLKDLGATLAPIRISQRLNRPKPNINDYIRLNRKNAGGQVTLRTIQYIEKLIRAVDMKSSKSHVNGKCSSLLFQYVSGIVFAGDTNESEGNFRWFDAVKAWNIPSGDYFIIDSY